jgi:hypothetical protein
MIVEVGDRFGLDRFYVIGSAAVLAAIPDPPPGALTATRDIDIVPPDDDEQVADRISFVLGEASEFDIEHGFYAEGVTSLTPTYAPQGWQGRANPVKVGQYTALCMEPHDLVMSKIGAGREKDMEFARAAFKLGLVNQERLQILLSELPVDDSLRAIFERRIAALAK